jgi:hypothetical protein
MDEVLREALCISDPDALFGPARETWEYVEGELIVRGAKPSSEGGAPMPPEHPTPAPIPGNA